MSPTFGGAVQKLLDTNILGRLSIFNVTWPDRYLVAVIARARAALAGRWQCAAIKNHSTELALALLGQA